MSTQMLILDFDGTVTDAESEGAPFREGYLQDLALLTDRSLEDITGMAEAFEARIAVEQGANGWVYDGHIVAPATVDPYLRIMPVARMIFDECGCFLQESDRSRLLDAILFKYNYQKTGMALKPEAFEVLSKLSEASLPAYILSNSHTAPIQNKLRYLGQQQGDEEALSWWFERVHGRAKKYVVQDGFESLDAHLQIPGLERPVLLRRPIYFEALESLRTEHAIAWSQVLVVGDIFELDLALPLHLGARVALVANDFSPPYEIDFLQAHPRGHVLRSLHEIFPLLEE